MAIAYLTAWALARRILGAAWAAEGLARTRIATAARGDVERTPRLGGLAFLGMVVLNSALVERRAPGSLLAGTQDLRLAALALVALAGAALAAARGFQPRPPTAGMAAAGARARRPANLVLISPS